MKSGLISENILLFLTVGSQRCYSGLSLLFCVFILLVLKKENEAFLVNIRGSWGFVSMNHFPALRRWSRHNQLFYLCMHVSVWLKGHPGCVLYFCTELHFVSSPSICLSSFAHSHPSWEGRCLQVFHCLAFHKSQFSHSSVQPIRSLTAWLWLKCILYVVWFHA